MEGMCEWVILLPEIASDFDALFCTLDSGQTKPPIINQVYLVYRLICVRTGQIE